MLPSHRHWSEWREDYNAPVDFINAACAFVVFQYADENPDADPAEKLLTILKQLTGGAPVVRIHGHPDHSPCHFNLDLESVDKLLDGVEAEDANTKERHRAFWAKDKGIGAFSHMVLTYSAYSLEAFPGMDPVLWPKGRDLPPDGKLELKDVPNIVNVTLKAFANHWIRHIKKNA